MTKNEAQEFLAAIEAEEIRWIRRINYYLSSRDNDEVNSPGLLSKLSSLKSKTEFLVNYPTMMEPEVESRLLTQIRREAEELKNTYKNWLGCTATSPWKKFMGRTKV